MAIGDSGWDSICEFCGWNLAWFEKMDVLHSIFSEYPSAGAVRCREGNCGGDCVESCVGAGVEVVGDGYFVTSSPGSPTQLHLF